MIGPSIASSLLKIGRAEEHFLAFQAELGEWTQADPYHVKKEHNKETGRHTLVVKIEKPAPIDRWSLIASDCVHNLRSALNHLVYALAIKNTGTNPPPNSRSLQFPIADSKVAFEKQRPRI